MTGCIIVGAVCLFIGALIGVTTTALCVASRDRDDICHGCSDAVSNDCQNCTRKGDEHHGI